MLRQSPFSVTPWVRRLLAANGVVYLLMITVFTGAWFVELLGFSPSRVAARPWTIATYMFVHGSFFHLLFNMVMLFFFGPPVEDRLGSSTFIKYYAFCGMGGVALSFAFAPIWPVGTIVGASGAIFGVMVAFVRFWPDARVFVFPIPVPIKAIWLVSVLVTFEVLAQLRGSNDGIAHLAHIGGVVFGLLFLKRMEGWGRPAAKPKRDLRARVFAHPGAHEEHRVDPPAPTERTRSSYEEVDRVLDKISATGLASLTPDERRLLDEMSQRLRDR